MSCAEARLGLGAYVVGALDPAERAGLESHLDECPACRDELAGLAGLPGLLSHLSADEVEAGNPSPPDGLLDRLLAEVGRERTRDLRRRRVLAAAAAVVVLAAGGTAAGLTMSSSPPAQHPVAATATVSASDPRTHVAASAELWRKSWGTQVSLQLSGVPAGEHCSLVAVARDGHREVAGSWQASYQGTAQLTGAVSIAPADLARLEIVTFSGQRLVVLPVKTAALS